jgi:hypothetical protein
VTNEIFDRNEISSAVRAAHVALLSVHRDFPHGKGVAAGHDALQQNP